MSEIAKYEAYKKKLQGICDENNLVFRFRRDTYPITLTIKPVGGMGAQLSMLENVEETGYTSPDAYIMFTYKDGDITYKTSETFTIGEALFKKILNLFKNMYFCWLQYFFRDVIERNALKEGMKPEIDESDAADDSDGLPEGAEPLEDYDDEGGEDLLPEDEDDTLPDVDEAAEGSDPVEGEDGVLSGATADEIAKATSIIRMENKASTSLLQRRMNIGYAKAAKIIDALEEQGVVGHYNGSQPREVLPFDEPDEEVADNA